MIIDVDHQISAVARTVGDRVLEAGTARVVTARQTYTATLDELWDACTSAERIPRWFLPISGDLREGGRYQLEGQAGGTVQRCSAPHGFAATWEYGGEVSWIELRLTSEVSGRTRFELEHTAHVDDQRWAEFGPGAVGVGWDLALLGLVGHLGFVAAPSPSEGAAWAASDEGKQYITLSSEAWREASVAAATEPHQARAAAERTTAFYTGVPVL
jgi:uncharacterized protein YndB with AHSA1/START domain